MYSGKDNKDFREFEQYYLYKFKQYLSSVGRAVRNRQLKEVIYR